jgi:hypothetical protein
LPDRCPLRKRPVEKYFTYTRKKGPFLSQNHVRGIPLKIKIKRWSTNAKFFRGFCAAKKETQEKKIKKWKKSTSFFFLGFWNSHFSTEVKHLRVSANLFKLPTKIFKCQIFSF